MHHNESMTCILNPAFGATLPRYSTVYVLDGSEDLPIIHPTTTIGNCCGVTMADCEPGDMVTVQLIFEDILPARVYGDNAWPGKPVVFGATVGCLSTNEDTSYNDCVAYIVRASEYPRDPLSTDPKICDVVFVRSKRIIV